jgi:F420-non-reducing hydrogenase iron-sulfur subunit
MPGVKHDTLPKIMILATGACAYPGADYVGQIHAEYPTNTYIVRVPAPVIFPEKFYLRCFEKGIAGILVMSCGHECPYAGAYDGLAARISRVHQQMAERGIRPDRLRLCAICSVCSKAFLNEVRQMHEKVLQATDESV